MKFKVGDKVRVVKEFDWEFERPVYKPAYVGKEGKILEIDLESMYPVKLDLLQKMGIYPPEFTFDELELVEDTPKSGDK